MVTIGLVPEITANLLDLKNCINITNSTDKNSTIYNDAI